MNPDTEKCPYCGSDLDLFYHIDMCGIKHTGGIKYYCKTMVKGSIRGDLCLEREARQKAEADYKDTFALLERRNGEVGKAEVENQKLRELLERAIPLIGCFFGIEGIAALNQIQSEYEKLNQR